MTVKTILWGVLEKINREGLCSLKSVCTVNCTVRKNKAGNTARQSRSVGQEQEREIRPELRNMMDRLTDRPTH